MRCAILPPLIVASLLMLASCASAKLPPYSQVRDETLAVLDAVAKSVPEATEIARTPEFDPYPCNERLTFGTQSGAFFTGQWTIYVDADFDVPDFVERVPQILGEGWEVDPLDIPLSFAQVRMIRESPHMSLTVEESVQGDRKAVELLAMSQCGVPPLGDDTPTN